MIVLTDWYNWQNINITFYMSTEWFVKRHFNTWKLYEDVPQFSRILGMTIDCRMENAKAVKESPSTNSASAFKM